MSRCRLRAALEYDGAGFHGFQVQPQVRTVQGELQDALAEVTAGRTREVQGAGRTDAGVHAAGQVVHFDYPLEAVAPIEKLAGILNRRWAGEVVVREVGLVDTSFHARYSALWRAYEYWICRGPAAPPWNHFVWSRTVPGEVSAWQHAAAGLVGEHDFRGISTDPVPDRAVREVLDVQVSSWGDLLKIEIRANAFLRTMVRYAIGLLADIVDGRRAPSELLETLRTGERPFGLNPAPAKGLCLTRVAYPDGWISGRTNWLIANNENPTRIPTTGETAAVLAVGERNR